MESAAVGKVVFVGSFDRSLLSFAFLFLNGHCT